MKTVSYLALGDSYTIGESVAEKDRWPVSLATKLTAHNISVSNPKIIATTGWTTDELKKAIEEANIQNTYGMVSLLIGVNNQYRGADRGYTLEVYKKELQELLDTAVKFAGGNKNRVFVVSIPDYSVTPFAKDSDTDKITEELKVYNSIKKELAEAMGVKFLDITPISLEAKDDLSLVAEDKLHPSGKMYNRWVDEVIFKEVLAMLKQ